MYYFMYLPNRFYHISSKFLLLVMSWNIWICDGRVMSSDICRPPRWSHSFDLSLSDVSLAHSVFAVETEKVYLFRHFCSLLLVLSYCFSFPITFFHPFLYIHLLLASYFIVFLFFEFVFFHHHSLSIFPSFSSSNFSSYFYCPVSSSCATSFTIFWSTLLRIKVDASISILTGFSSCISEISNARIFSAVMHLNFTRIWHFLLHYYKNLQ